MVCEIIPRKHPCGCVVSIKLDHNSIYITLSCLGFLPYFKNINSVRVNDNNFNQIVIMTFFLTLDSSYFFAYLKYNSFKGFFQGLLPRFSQGF